MTARWRVSGPVVTLLLALLIHVVGMLLIKGFGTTFGVAFNSDSNRTAWPISAFCRSGSCGISRSIVSGPS